MEQFRGRVAVVTGAASGIGRGMADAFVAAGMQVVLADVQEDALGHAEKELLDAGAEVLAVPTDVADPDAVAGLRDAALDRFGAVHVLCNNAGVGGFARVETLTLDHWNWVLGVSLWGVINGLTAFLPTLLAQDEAHVVNTASFGGFFPTRGLAPYGAAKAAVISLSESLYMELQDAGSAVGVTVLCPGPVATAIANDERNLPAGMVRRAELDPSPQMVVRQGQNAERMQAGKPPAEVAAMVLAAIRQRQFYLHTAPELLPLLDERFDRIRTARNP
jgi:NAD(P)-dependent dehydrogenase (short-subunit alcohol dehydrogenase family)